MSTKPSAGPERFVTIGLLLAIVMLGMGLRLYQLDADSLWLDEITTVITSRLDIVSMLDYQAEQSVHPPLLYLMTRLFLILLGDRDFVVRLPAALLGSLSVLLTYKVGEVLWTRKEGMIGAFLLAISAYHVGYSQEARHYSLMVFLALLSLIFLLKALQSGQKRMWILFGLCAGLNIYTHYFAFLILASEVLFAAWVILEDWLSCKRQRQHASLNRTPPACFYHQSTVSADQSPPAHCGIPAFFDLLRPRKQALSLLAVLAIVGVSYVPWLPFMCQQLIGRRIQFEGLGEGMLPRTELSVAFFSDALRAYTQVDGALLWLFLALFALGLAHSRVRHIMLFGLWIAIPSLFPFIVRSSHFFSLRYALFVVPILLLGITRGVSVLAGWLTHRLPVVRGHQQWRLALTSVLAVSVFGGLSVVPLRDYYLIHKTDYRGVARYIEQTLLPGDVVLADGEYYRTVQDAGWTQRCLSYYLGSHHEEHTPILLVERGLWASLQDVPRSDGEVVAVLARRYRPARWDRQSELILVDFEDLSVVHLRQRSGDLMRDSISMLEALLDLLRLPEARFDVHLALAEAYAQMGRDVEAASQIVLASTVMPDDQRAVTDLSELGTELQHFLDVQLEDVRLGETLSFRGYSIHSRTVRAGEAVDITMWWQTVSTMDRDYTAFIHVIGPDGRILVQEDRLVRSGARPTSAWRMGEEVWAEHRLELPPDTEPGQYLVTTGLYYWETGERLAVWHKNGRRLPGDTIVLDHITITD